MIPSMEYLFGPLDKGYCVYFYYLSIIFFAIFAISFFLVVVNLLSKKKSMSFTSIYLVLTQPFLMYFINRLYYSMCVRSLA